MKKGRAAQSAFFNLRVLVGFLVCGAAASSMLSGALLAFLRSETSANRSQRTLTFAERVAYQRAIEQVYWRHRIWPKERPDPKPSLDTVMSQAQLETKVEDYLRDSQALEDYWQRPITPDQLQAEMERMASHTKQPGVLCELFEVLGNDPFIIAECLARATLSERLKPSTVEWRKGPLTFWKAHAEDQLPKLMAALSESYTLPVIAGPSGVCTDDTWTPTSLTNAPDARTAHTAVWTGSEMIVWGGFASGHGTFNSGGRYNPSTDGWTATSLTNAPAVRDQHTAVWTGSEMIVWGGSNLISDFLNSGGRYNPSTDSWTATSTTNAPAARGDHTAVWIGSEMIVWGGYNFGGAFNTGGRYNPSTDSWTATSTTSAPAVRYSHTAVWVGSQMIVWGGFQGGSLYLNSGGRYDPGTDSWTATSTTGAPAARDFHTAVWTGSEMIIWGGEAFGPVYMNTGGRYNPSTDSWTVTSATNAPSAREVHAAVWTGGQMIVWGGSDGTNYFNTGGRYCAAAPSPTPTPTPTSTPTPTPTASATPTLTPSATARPTPIRRPRPSPAPRPTPH